MFEEVSRLLQTLPRARQVSAALRRNGADEYIWIASVVVGFLRGLGALLDVPAAGNLTEATGSLLKSEWAYWDWLDLNSLNLAVQAYDLETAAELQRTRLCEGRLQSLSDLWAD